MGRACLLASQNGLALCPKPKLVGPTGLDEALQGQSQPGGAGIRISHCSSFVVFQTQRLGRRVILGSQGLSGLQMKGSWKPQPFCEPRPHSTQPPQGTFCHQIEFRAEPKSQETICSGPSTSLDPSEDLPPLPAAWPGSRALQARFFMDSLGSRNNIGRQKREDKKGEKRRDVPNQLFIKQGIWNTEINMAG